MSDKKWVFLFFFFFILFSLPLVLCNYFIDPLWLFNHQYSAKYPQKCWDERKQKTNYLTFRKEKFDGLLLGSSRGAFLDVSHLSRIQKERIFNYSCSSMKPIEFSAYARYFKTTQGIQEPIRIYLALDFFGVNKNARFDFEDPESYFQKSQHVFYRLSHLFSFDCFQFSLANLFPSYMSEKDFYHRDSPSHRLRVNEHLSRRQLQTQFETYREHVYGNFLYDDSVKTILEQFYEEHRADRIVVFTTPISSQLFLLLLDQGRWEDYAHWLRDLVEVFGSVYNFMEINPIAEENSSEFLDYHHLNPQASQKFFDALYTHDSQLGTRLTPENIDAYLEALAEKLNHPLVHVSSPHKSTKKDWAL